jgi:hypothetical protein
MEGEPMATYHTEHSFQPGMLSTVWNPVTRKHESKPNPHFCSVCGRKEQHILHGNPVYQMGLESIDGEEVRGIFEFDSLN